jgi:hypothetical protein
VVPYRPSLLLTIGLLLSITTARADTEPIRIEYHAHAGCPSTTDFERLVFARTNSARRAIPGEPARIFTVTLTQDDKGVTGRLVVREADGESVARRVSGARCEDIAAVLALATALAIDPHAALSPDTEDQQPAFAESAPPSPVAAPSSSASPVDTDEPYTPSTPRGPWAFALGLGPRLFLGTTPKPALGGGIWLEARPSHQHRFSVGIELALLQTPSSPVQDAALDFQFFLADPQICPHLITLTDSLALDPCVGFELGLVTGRSSGIQDAQTARRFWAAVDPLLRLQLTPEGSWFLALEAGAQVPLSRYRFVFHNPTTTVHPVPSIAGVAAVRIGVRQ